MPVPAEYERASAKFYDYSTAHCTEDVIQAVRCLVHLRRERLDRTRRPDAGSRLQMQCVDARVSLPFGTGIG